MTDVAARHDGEHTAEHDVVATTDGAASEPRLEWAPAEPRPKKRRLALWIGIPVGALALGTAAASLLLIAPGTSIAGVPVGFLTPGAAAAAVQDRLDATALEVDGTRLTGADLGASVDAQDLAAAAFDARPAWNVTQWFGDPVSAEIALDADAAATALRAAQPDLYVDPLPAEIAFDGSSYMFAPAVAGSGIDLAVTRDALQGAFDTGAASAALEPQSAPVEPATTTEAAELATQQLNAMLDGVGFYVGDERTVPVPREVAADWMTVTVDDDGAFVFAADPAKIQAVVDTLPGLVNRDPQNGVVYTNAGGEVLDDSDAGLDGRVLGDTAGVADDFAEQLATADGAFRLPVETTPVTTETVVRVLEVDISEQRLYLKENDVVVDSWLVSTGRYGADTEFGRYTIGWKTPVQTMYGTAPDSGVQYEQPDVRWAMYFNGDQAFHGVYWHSNWGNRMSAGCVGMPNWRAEQIYGWAVEGTDVWIHA